MCGMMCFFCSSRRRHTRCREVSWARRCVQETASTRYHLITFLEISIYIVTIQVYSKQQYTVNRHASHVVLKKRRRKLFALWCNAFYWAFSCSIQQLRKTVEQFRLPQIFDFYHESFLPDKLVRQNVICIIHANTTINPINLIKNKLDFSSFYGEQGDNTV
eukprot:TRINITY_DN21901_c0_g2_i1.p1 TRINITY_DN21901_c0_g2~~TRINITY_DN21901_c0_g2_i1.p1  ORF type:complete len:161 (+),score=9.58 TRINITY_DN21901_c0_g2_i1:15-497(+)